MSSLLGKIRSYRVMVTTTPVTRLIVSRVGRAVRRLIHGDPSQAGELAVVKSLISAGFPPYLVDVGAHDGSSISNSSHFVKAGWRAILVEPAPGAFRKLSERYKDSSRVVCLNVACSDKGGVQEFFLGTDGPDGMLGTLCTDENEWFARTRSEQSIEIKVKTLTEILAESGFPKDFSLLLIDTEGMDYECLQGLDFEQFVPRIIVTEEYSYGVEKNRKKHELLGTHGYTLHRRVGGNTIWARKDL
jgi:FkbM family methyltransferase